MEGYDSSFGAAMRRQMVEKFAVSYYNGSLKPNFAERNPTTGRDVEYLMDGPQFDRTRKSEVWSYSNAVGTGYQYRVVYKDRRFSELDRLMEVYSGTAESTEEERARTEQSLYLLILLMTKEGRLPKGFKVQTAGELQEQKLLGMMEELGRSMDELGRRVRAIEEQLAAHPALPVQTPEPPASESIPSV